MFMNQVSELCDLEGKMLEISTALERNHERASVFETGVLLVRPWFKR
jgi:hypothetical protein